jgi:regulator of nucleoside diphosphate kinase
MTISTANVARPPIHVLASESDIIAGIALSAEDRHPVVAAMLLEEIERADLHQPETLPAGAVRLGSEITFVEERTRQVRKVQLVLPGQADINEGRISILTPIGAALYGLKAGDAIEWPDIEGNERRIRIEGVTQPSLRYN